MNGSLHKSNTDKIMLGICGGIAEYFRFNSTRVRIFFFIFSAVMFWIYIILFFIMPSDNLL